MLLSAVVDVRTMLLIAAGVSGCSSGNDVEAQPVDAPPPAKSAFSFETFNTTLFYAADDWILEARRRAAAMPAAIARSEADVLCLQAVWLPSDRRAIVDGARSTFPYAVELPSDDDTPVDDPRAADGSTPPPFDAPPCAGQAAVVDTLLKCLSASCATPGAGVSSVSCISTSCAAERDALPSDARCRACVDGQLFSGEPIARVGARCLTRTEPFPYNGGHGLVLLSRHPLEAPERRVLPSTEGRSAVLRARVRLPNGASVAAYCSGLTWPRTSDRYIGRYGSPERGWLTEHLLQTQQIVEWMSATPRAVLMIETGASTEHTVDGTVLVERYESDGINNLLATLAEGIAPGALSACTLCSSNPLIRPPVRRWSSRIFLRGLAGSAVTASYRTMLGAVVPVPQAIRGTSSVPLSGFYGYRAVVSVPP